MTSEQQPAYTVRLCDSIEDFTQCVEMQRTVWKFPDAEVTPVRAFVITMHSGGFTYGAFDEDGRLLGFSHALAAFDKNKRPFIYSHMAAVSPGLQNAGIGAKLKLIQRDHALRIGVWPVKWTFDPLLSRNAKLNINKLGGVVRTYHVNYYGNFSTSEMWRGLDTDRLFVEWWVQSAHVADALAGKCRADVPVAAVEVPYDIDTMKKEDLNAAREWQLSVRNGFKTLLAEGLYCAGFEAGRNGGQSRYLFFKDEHIEEG
jgi:predicted GNAT superfamily acetyltransferase